MVPTDATDGLRHCYVTATEFTVIMSCLLQAIHSSVTMNPSSIAVETQSGEQLSYLSLWSASVRFSDSLKSYGIAPDDIIGVAVQEGLEVVVCFLSILRVGGAIACIDLDVNLERHIACFNECKMKFVIAYDCDVERLRTSLPLEVKIISADILRSLARTTFNTDVIRPGTNESAIDDACLGPATDSNLAWVYTTSGCTGQPSLFELGCTPSHSHPNPLRSAQGRSRGASCRLGW